MASNIDNTSIDATYPIAGQDNDSQGFRDNFTVIKLIDLLFNFVLKITSFALNLNVYNYYRYLRGSERDVLFKSL